MFRIIEVYKDYKKYATQRFREGVTVVPKEGDYIKIEGMIIAYRVKLVTFNYATGTIEISVD